MKLPKISAIIPVYNGEQTIRRALRSLTSQNYPQLEIIVVDGGSSDNTCDNARSLLCRTDLLISESDKGQLHAVQKGLAIASGEVCYWLNADDLSAPGALWAVGKVFAERPCVDFVYSDDWVWDERMQRVFVGQTIRYLKFEDHLTFYRQMYSECVFWRTRLNACISDWDYSLRAATDYFVTLQLQSGADGRIWLRDRLGIFSIAADGEQLSKKYAGRVHSEQNKIRTLVQARLNAAGVDAKASWLGFHWRNSFLRNAQRLARVVGRLRSGDSDRMQIANFIKSCSDE